MLTETHESMMLRITLATANDEAQQGITAALSWTWTFDADLGYLNITYKRLRVTHLMFWPKHPAHIFVEGYKVPSEDPYPIGSPGMPKGRTSRHAICADVTGLLLSGADRDVRGWKRHSRRVYG
jgi:hypothetical protein